MRSAAQLAESALDRALAAADASGAAWHDEAPASYSDALAAAFPGSFVEPRDLAALSRASQQLARVQLAAAAAAAASAAAPPAKSGAVGQQLDAALREVTAVLRRGRVSPESLHPVRLLAVRAAAAGAEQRANATAARAAAARSEALRRRGEQLDGERAAAARPGWRSVAPPGLRWQEHARLDETEALTLYQLSVTRAAAEPAVRHAPPVAAPPPARAESRASQTRGLAHAAGLRRLQAATAQHGAAAHNALLKRTARVAAAWHDDDEDE